MARIVDTDNFGGDYPDERFLLWPMPGEDAQKICNVLNDRAGAGSLRFYKIVPNDYRLEPGLEP